MKLVTRTDTDTGEPLVWCGGKDFDLLKTQEQVRGSGMVIREVREDRWAVLVPFYAVAQETEEIPNG